MGILEPQDDAGRRIESYSIWGRYALITLALIAVIFVLSSGRREESAVETKALNSEMFGDYYLKSAFFAKHLGSSIWAGAAAALKLTDLEKMVVTNYRTAAKYPVPGAIRRYGVYREYAGEGDALSVLRRLTSKPVFEEVPKGQQKRLREELRMWEDIYAGRKSPIPQAKVDDYRSRIEKLSIGPVKSIALNRLYVAAGNRSEAERVLAQAGRRYSVMFSALFALGFLLFGGGLVGVGLLVAFVSSRRRLFEAGANLSSYCERIHHPVLWLSFLAYMVAFVLASIVVGVAVSPVAADAPPDVQVLYLLIAQLLASVLSGMAGLGTLVYFTKMTGGDLCAVGLTMRDFWKNVGWGFMGYAVLLPILAIAAALSSVLFGGGGNEGHPIVPMLLSSGWFSKLAVFILASVLAPFFEETFFRGVLYNALRARMKIVGAVLVSAAAFAIVHPQLPAGFLPIFAIGTIFALLFEIRKSLIPSMVAHALNNTVVLLIVILGFAS